ncbi:MAG: 2-oxoglutarate dehydrogenase, subunit, partial [Chlamydiia bacterium]|nr:2-oxoglutarate dehydrogenase, subunit [Chlamydiia bacterium]
LRLLTEKKAAFQVDFGFGEALAFATIVVKYIPIRLVGQDSRRGTFSQRHAVIFDQKSAECFIPLHSLPQGDELFEVYDSPLSEYASLGFEYGYSLANTVSLVIWEAQFGDFANGAQIIIDQYIASGKSKWGDSIKLTLLLPHGYEGQGPEHSSARMERYLQLAAEDNLTIAVPTTPSQYFHLLVKQAYARRPLIIFTPKGLLRHPDCVSPLIEFSEGRFQEVIDDEKVASVIQELIFCQGHIFYQVKRALKPTSARIRI